MSLKDFFKKKKGEPEKEKLLKKEKLPAQKKEKGVKKTEAKNKEKASVLSVAKPRARSKKDFEKGHAILKSPHITEKATDLAGKNQYVFKVLPQANKQETKRAIENIFDVDVESVKIINVPRKKRRMGRTEGFRKGYKKAVVKVKRGQKIEVLPK